MKKMFLSMLVVLMAFAFMLPVMAAPSYDTAVVVNVTPDDKAIILAGDSVDVTFSVEVANTGKSGDLPQVVVTPLGDNTETLAASKVTKIAKGNTVVFEFTVTYTQPGEYEFQVNIKNMQGNSGKWNYEFTSEPVLVTIIAPPEEETLPEGFTVDDSGLSITKDALNVGNFAANGKDLTVTYNGNPLGNGDWNANNNGISIKAKALNAGTYIITNTATKESITFVINLDGSIEIL